MNDTNEVELQPRHSRRARAGIWGLLASALVAVLLAAVVAPAGAANGVIKQRTDVLGQGGDGVHQEDGARLKRHNNAVKVNWSIATPEPDSYDYPSADMIPPGAPPHPEVVPGYPEVFTLWAFVFNYPEFCSEPCNSDDVGETPAQGGVFQLDATVATGDQIVMSGKIHRRDSPAAGVRLQEPKTAEVHVAMAPHGRAGCGDDLLRQLAGPIGTPAFWFPALFLD